MMEAEIAAAVAWWTATLRQPAFHQTGEPDADLLAIYLGSTYYVEPTQEQLVAFTMALTRLLTHLVEESKPDPVFPHQGSALRVFGTDYGPDGLLSDALKESGVRASRLIFPMKTVMWVDPGCVKVACGYGAPLQVIYGKDL